MVLKMMSELVERRINKPIKTEYLGPQIKKKRKEKELTQEDISKGICCISYLSKVENGQMAGNYSIIMEMMRKLDMETNVIENVEKYREYIILMIKAYALNDELMIEEIYHKTLLDGEIYYADLIRLIYFIYKEDLDSAKLVISNLLIIRETLEDNELIVFMIMLANNYFLCHEYLMAMEVYDLISRFNIFDTYAQLILNEGIFLVKIKLGRFLGLCDAYQSYLDSCFLVNDFSRSLVAKAKYAFVLLYCMETKKGNALLDSIMNKLNNDEKNKYLAMQNVYNEKYLEAIMYADLLHDTEMYLVKIYCYDKLGDVYSVKNLLNNITTSDFTFEQTLFFESIKNKYHDAGSFYYKKYLRETAFPYVYKNSDYVLSYYYGQELIDLLKKEANYKEATMISKKLLLLK